MGPHLTSPEIIAEDDHVLTVVKPAGIPTANAARGMPSLFTILRHARAPGSFLGVVSRLDAPVSGVLILAKTRSAAADLSRQFRERLVEKTYDAVIEGRFPAPVGEWVDWYDRIERRDDERFSRLYRTGSTDGLAEIPQEDDDADSKDAAGGSECHLRARVVKRLGEVSRVELAPSTGRRHQLRVQLAARGCPIVGDRGYGARLPFPSAPGYGAAIALHASRLALCHPATKRHFVVEAHWPETWKRRFAAFSTS